MYVPVDESIVGFSGTLKSPPKITIPSWKVERRSQIFLKNVTWCSFGQYIFASVIGLEANVPLIKMYLPSWSISESVILKSACFEMSMEAPLVLEIEFVECNTRV